MRYGLKKRIVSAVLASVSFLGTVLPSAAPVYASQVSGPKNGTVEHLIVLGDCTTPHADGTKRYSLVADMYDAVKKEYSTNTDGNRADYATADGQVGNGNDADGTDSTGMPLNMWFFADSDKNGRPDWYDSALASGSSGVTGKSDGNQNEGSSNTGTSVELTQSGLTRYVKEMIEKKYHAAHPSAEDYTNKRTQAAMHKVIVRYTSIVLDLYKKNKTDVNSLVDKISDMYVNWQNGDDGGSIEDPDHKGQYLGGSKDLNDDPDIKAEVKAFPIHMVTRKGKRQPDYSDYKADVANSEKLFSGFQATEKQKSEDTVLTWIKRYNAAATDLDHDGKPDTKTAVVIYYGLDQVNDVTSVRHDEDVKTNSYHRWAYHPAYYEHDHDTTSCTHYIEDKDKDGKTTGGHYLHDHDMKDCTHYHEAYWECIPVFKHKSNVVDHQSAPEQYNTNLSEAVKAWADAGALVYWVGMLPGYGYDKKGYSTDPESYGYWQTKFNNMLESNMPSGCSYLDVNNAVIDKVPYFVKCNYSYGYEPKSKWKEKKTAKTSEWNWKNQDLGKIKIEYMSSGPKHSEGETGWGKTVSSIKGGGRIWMIEDGDSETAAESNATTVGKDNPWNRWDGDTDTDGVNVKRLFQKDIDLAAEGKASDPEHGNKGSTVAKTNMVIDKDYENGINRFVRDGKMGKSRIAHSPIYGVKCIGCEQNSSDTADHKHPTDSGDVYTDASGYIHEGGYWDQEKIKLIFDANPVTIDGKTANSSLYDADYQNGRYRFSPAGYTFYRYVVQNGTHEEKEENEQMLNLHAADNGSQGMSVNDTVNVDFKNGKVLHEIMTTHTSNWKQNFDNDNDDQVGFSEDELQYSDEDYGYEYSPSREQLNNEKVMKYTWKYDTKTLQYVYHIILNTIYTKNDRKHTTEAIDTNFYSISCSLTTWINAIMSGNKPSGNSSSGEDQDAADASQAADTTQPHDPGAVSSVSDKSKPAVEDTDTDLGSSGNAGAVLGFGSSDFNFAPFLASASSKTSTGVSYKALEKNGSFTKDELIYARYGHLLADLGFDGYGMKTTGGSGRTVPGGVLTILFTASAFSTKAMQFMIKGLQFINPFQFLQNISNGKYKSELSGRYDILTEKVSVQSQVPKGISNPLVSRISYLYDTINSIAWAVTVPLMFAVTIFLILVWNRDRKSQIEHKGETSQQIKTLIFKVVFLAVGIPLLGMLYTSVLHQMDIVTDETNSPASEAVLSSFVDFGTWAKNNRLDPTGTLVYDNSSESADAASIREARSTAYAINKRSGAVSSDLNNLFSKERSTAEWNRRIMESSGSDSAYSEAYRLLSDYMQCNFYYPSDWETDVMSVLNNNMSEKNGDNEVLGRRQGAVENGDSFKKDEAQGGKTVYNMFSETNTADKWLSRSVDDNTNIFAADGKKWEGFNIFNNGGELGKVSGDKTIYKSSGDTRLDKGDGKDISTKGGLSTISMYNYLSSRFADDGVVTYSNQKNASLQSRLSHYSVNMIGGGAFKILYFLNTAAVMLVTAIIAIDYALGTIVSLFKRGIKVMASIPGAALGVMRSMIVVIVTVVMMIAEVIGTIFTYTIVTQLLNSLVSVLTGFTADLVNESSSGISFTKIGGQLAGIAGMFSRSAGVSMTSAAACSIIMAISVIGFAGAVLIKYRWAYHSAVEALESILEKKLLPKEVLDVLKEDKTAALVYSAERRQALYYLRNVPSA